ncbi:uncharacterized protein K452DRAFT_167691 [Aplosporella prunicola CBS 121167]|uniref:Secreted protein n=1 Tax=Aplosporella prunicola CBS 121167 TaxID=1176127 RepID=A0A6A6BGC0_9PEZI|nr:uncharacterized protein K452DRAFT_167691 [Aplosporella prunicola CBS 121167]KAF2143220.1 hypothetical protein K452DRAFT_167691 [Aplosporella prunicola CBS 121167]
MRYHCLMVVLLITTTAATANRPPQQLGYKPCQMGERPRSAAAASHPHKREALLRRRKGSKYIESHRTSVGAYKGWGVRK